MFGAIGVVTLLITNAATPTASYEAESASRSTNVSIVSDGTASGGQAIRFNQPTVTPPSGVRCEMNLHWYGPGGAPGVTQADRNAPPPESSIKFWPRAPYQAYWNYDGPHNFTYDPGATADEQAYQSLVMYLRGHLEQRNCGPTIILGYSNGGGLAAKLYCRGEDFGDRVFGYIVDDPVMDNGVLNCQPSSNIRKTHFIHSSELSDAAAGAASIGYSCNVTTWYCEDNRTMSLTQYEARIGVDSQWQRPLHSSLDGATYAISSTHMPSVWWTAYPN